MKENTEPDIDEKLLAIFIAVCVLAFLGSLAQELFF